MAIQLSPSVVVQERDLTNVIPAVSASAGATIIDAVWGPVLEVTTVDSENALASQFGKPNANNAASWFTAANFLSYANNLKVVRTDTYGQRNAVATPTGQISSITITTAGTNYTGAVTLTIDAPTIFTVADGGRQATAVAEVTSGNITKVTITDPGSGYNTNALFTVTVSAVRNDASSGTTAVFSATVAASGVKLNNEADYLSTYSSGTIQPVGQWIAKYPGSLGNSISVSIADSTNFSTWDYKNNFSAAPGTSSFAAALAVSASNTAQQNIDAVTAVRDELHIVVIDTYGKWSGTAGTILETYAFLSKASNAKKEDGSTAYYKNVINTQSNYIWWTRHLSVNWTGSAFVAFASDRVWGREAAQGIIFGTIAPVTPTGTTVAQPIVNLSGGVDDLSSTNGQKTAAFDLFSDAESLDVNLVMCGKADSIVANYVVQNVAEVRKDCVAFISPENISTKEVLSGTTSAVATSIIAYRNAITSSSYAVIDSGYKYQYDRYNDEYRWVPLNGDVAGLCARTDYTDDPWFSPAGLNRGQIKNVVKLAFNPRKTDRDNLYNAGINPVASFPGQGVVLFGDKTALAKPSAFDRINVRRLFITLEKSISTAAKFQLFEFNDGFTRAQFKNIVEPFLRDVKGRRGITDFLVVCDETNNTSQVIDTNRFVADIYIKPARSINFIQLNFIATRTGASFNEIAG